ncbi:MAG: aldehyde dehydrogenase family protein [Microscillaceae bacterium]|nr:aldehyde dehydrogenase family protein [Microscillaceae bacterium]MDW8460848.1 aldehyde dehydrogenase family protein [Cytophagales bacterium]
MTTKHLVDKHTIEILQTLQLKAQNPAYYTGLVSGSIEARELKDIFSPIDGQFLASVAFADEKEYEYVITTAQKAFPIWQQIPAPKRGEIVRQIGNKLRLYKEPLGKLVTLEMGKILQEGLGEVQEMIDICDFAVGLSRQLYGLTMHSERPEHRMYEQYHPLGIVGIISAFNFPVAVWSWNAMIAAVCGNVCVWKPSEKTPLTAIATQHIVNEVLQENHLPEGIFNLIIGDKKIGERMAKDERIPLISATGSTAMGKQVAQNVAARLGKTILELGGNNAIIITPNANLEMAVRATVFGAVGTCGQRCTTTRRLIVHKDVYETIKEKLVKIYQNLPIGNPLHSQTLVGPLVDKQALENFKKALIDVQAEGGKLLVGGEVLTDNEYAKGCYVTPAIVEAKNHYPTVQKETFAPILYLIQYEGEVANAVQIQNDVKQGLSSAIFTTNLLEAEYFLSHRGSDCGIANVNIGTSGAEIGGAFGGEKETGGGRESGSDAWKAYMRRQTNTINYSTQLPLAQGIRFEINL